MPLSILKNVLHLEDEFLIAMDVAATLADAGVANVTHATSCTEALTLLEAAPIDAAILDAEVVDGSTEPVAQRLKEMGVPFVMYVGSVESLGVEHKGGERLLKPVAPSDLIATIKAVL